MTYHEAFEAVRRKRKIVIMNLIVDQPQSRIHQTITAIRENVRKPE